MDLKDWKKVSEDKHGVEMMHPKGHQMTILFKGVPLVQREALKRLPLYDGGKLKGVHKSSMEVDRPSGTKGGEKRMAGRSEAGEAVSDTTAKRLNPDREEKAHNEKQYSKAKDEHNRVLGEMRSMPNPKLKGLADGGGVHNSSDGQDKPPVSVNVNQAPSTASQQATAPTNPPVPQVSTAGPNPNLPNGSMNAPAAAQLAQQSASEQAKIDAAKAQALVPIEQAKLQAQQAQAQRDQDNINMLKQHADTMANTLQNIDPQHLVKNMSAPGKISTALGLALGGFSTSFGGQNFTADYLNKQIDRDIAAQQANNQKQKTIFDAYNTLYGNQNIASNMAKASMADIYASQAAVIAQKLGTPQALANLHKVQSDLSIIKNKAIMDSAGNLRAIPNNPNGQGARPMQTPQVPQAPGAAAPQNSGIENIDWKILKPGAADTLAEQLKYNPSIPDADKQKLSAQMTGAQQAEKALSDLHAKYAGIANEANHGGLSGWFHRKISPHALAATLGGVGALLGGTTGAGIGAAVGEGTGQLAHALTGTSQPVRQYDADKAAVTGYISAALKGTNISGEQIREIVEDNMPEVGDDGKTLDKKLTNLREFIQNHLETDALKREGYSYR